MTNALTAKNTIFSTEAFLTVMFVPGFTLPKPSNKCVVRDARRYRTSRRTRFR